MFTKSSREGNEVTFFVPDKPPESKATVTPRWTVYDNLKQHIVVVDRNPFIVGYDASDTIGLIAFTNPEQLNQFVTDLRQSQSRVFGPATVRDSEYKREVS